MATLSEDDSSWKASGVRRRDFRHSHDGPEVSGPKRKNTRKWCKGVVGREHSFVVTSVGRFGNHLIDKCEVCGKETSHRWDPAKPKPKWMW